MKAASYWSPQPYLKTEKKSRKRKGPRIDLEDKKPISVGNRPTPSKLPRIGHPCDYGGPVLSVHLEPFEVGSGAVRIEGRVVPPIRPAPPTQGYPHGIPRRANS